MKPHITHRAHERPAVCMRALDPAGRSQCAEEMQLIVTRSPLGHLPFEELIVMRCAAGHLERGDGVLPESWEAPGLIDPREYDASGEPPIDDGPADCWGAF